VTLPRRFARRFELSGEIETVEPLLFPLKRLCSELAAYLRARDSGARGYTLEFAHARGAPTRLQLRFLAPTRDATRLFAALQERLMRAPPEQPVRELFLEADDFATPRPSQGGLFEDAAGQTLEWEQALERVLARLGESAIWTPACAADHRPERAVSTAPRGTASAPPPARRPLWLLPEPKLLPQPPVPIDDAERIEAGWWDGADVSRDYHTVDFEDHRAWVFRDRHSGRWYVQGLWS
jgi:protein ImuB